MRIDSGTIPLPVRTIDSALGPGQLTGAAPVPVAARSGPEASAGAGSSFADLLGQALRRVNEAQLAADLAVERVATGEAQNLHDAVVAVEIADLSLRLTAQVVQRGVQAYQEISRMQL
ncbi:MAG: flagellar hook-basal body complex protein FliE [Armatimonadota bacterium]